MKPRLLLLPLLLACMAGTAHGAGAPARLPSWEQLTPAQRDLVLAPIRERWNADPEARARMFRHAQRWQQLTPDQRTRVRRGLARWDRMDPRQRATMRALFNTMRHMDPSERRALRDRWRAMTPQERRDWVRAHPAPAD